MNMLGLLFPFQSGLYNFFFIYGLSVVTSLVVNHLRRPGLETRDKHVFVTGGSSGLGLAIAKKFVSLGSHVTIAARNKNRLDEAVREIQDVAKSGQSDIEVNGVVCDVTNYEQTCDVIHKCKPIDILICCAGTAKPGYFIEQPIEVFRSQMDVNYFGVVNAVKAALPDMAEKKKGHIVVVASAMSLFSCAGYSQYGPSKWAARALSDTLRHELISHNVKVTAYYPSSMDTPGFVEENKTKPAETAEIEGTASLLSPEESANILIEGMKNGVYSITQEFLTSLLRIGANAVTPRRNTLLELLLLPVNVLVSFGFGAWMDSVMKPKEYRKNKND